MDHTNNSGLTPQQEEDLKKFAELFSDAKILSIEQVGEPKWVVPEGWAQDKKGNWYQEEKGKWAERQLSREQAIAFGESKQWESWTDEQIVRFQMFQKRVCVDFGRYHSALNTVLDRRVFTHEIHSDAIKEEYLGVRKAPTPEELILMFPEGMEIIKI